MQVRPGCGRTFVGEWQFDKGLLHARILDLCKNVCTSTHPSVEKCADPEVLGFRV